MGARPKGLFCWRKWSILVSLGAKRFAISPLASAGDLFVGYSRACISQVRLGVLENLGIKLARCLGQLCQHA